MPFSEAIVLAFASLRANKLRSFLTVLGILIGVSSVIAVVAITEGLDGYMSDKVLELGSRSFSVQRMPDIITSREMWLEMNKRKNIDLEDVEVVKRACDACAEVGGMVATSGSAKYGRVTQKNVRIMGITENFSRIGSIRELLAGRQLVPDDVEQARPVVVVGTDLTEAFFGTMEPHRQGDPGRRAPGQDRGGGGEEGQRVRRDPGQLRVDADHHLPQVLRGAALGDHPGRGPVHGRLRGRPGPGAGGHAGAPARRLRQARRLRDRDRPERHGPLAERHPRDLRGHDRGDRDQPGRGRDRGHEHHAGLGDRAHPRDRGPKGPGRPPAATSSASSWWSRSSSPSSGAPSASPGPPRSRRSWPSCSATSCPPTSRRPCACGR